MRAALHSLYDWKANGRRKLRYEEFLENCDADRPVRIAAVRRDGDGRDAALGGVARHGKRGLRVGRAVVHAGENMTMQVDHGPSFPRRGTAGRLWDRQMIS